MNEDETLPISTIGYEGSKIDDFLALLKHVGVEIVVDIRDLPLSRKKGFSKNALKDALSGESIDYIHIKSLGDPKEGREAARRGDFGRFYDVFSAHLSREDAEEGMKFIADISQTRHVCLMCFERDHNTCHRNIVIERMKKLYRIEVSHLGVPKGFGSRRAA